MAVPKTKISKARRGQRRSHDALSVTNWVEDNNTGEPKRRHHIDLKTGMYKGRQVLADRD
jgi:large subunit ribosomal protein L32